MKTSIPSSDTIAVPFAISIRYDGKRYLFERTDGNSRLVCSVPQKVLKREWRRLRTPPGDFSYIDPRRKTLIRFTTIVDSGTVSLHIALLPAVVGNAFSKLGELIDAT